MRFQERKSWTQLDRSTVWAAKNKLEKKEYCWNQLDKSLNVAADPELETLNLQLNLKNQIWFWNLKLKIAKISYVTRHYTRANSLKYLNHINVLFKKYITSPNSIWEALNKRTILQ